MSRPSVVLVNFVESFLGQLKKQLTRSELPEKLHKLRLLITHAVKPRARRALGLKSRQSLSCSSRSQNTGLFDETSRRTGGWASRRRTRTGRAIDANAAARSFVCERRPRRRPTASCLDGYSIHRAWPRATRAWPSRRAATRWGCCNVCGSGTRQTRHADTGCVCDSHLLPASGVGSDRRRAGRASSLRLRPRDTSPAPRRCRQLRTRPSPRMVSFRHGGLGEIGDGAASPTARRR